MKYSTSAELKARAKSQIIGNIGTVIGAFLVHMVLTIPFLFFIERIVTNSVSAIALYAGLLTLFNIFDSIFDMGDDLIGLKLACNQQVGVMDVFYGFRGQIGKVIGLKIIPILITTVVSLPFTIYSYRFQIMSAEILNEPIFTEYLQNPMILLDASRQSDIDMIYAATSKLLGYELFFFGLLSLQLVVSYAIRVYFGLVYFVALDYEDLSAREALKKSFGLMKGRWGRLIKLTLSFIPWRLLSYVSCYLSNLWVSPYIRTTFAEFYLDMVKNKNTNGD